MYKPFLDLSLVCLILIGFLISACSSRPKIPDTQEQVEKLTEITQSGGYVSGDKHPTESLREIWTHDSTELDVFITAPTAPGSFPLIIYLPSLGENAAAGRLWRETWAKAGYIVFTMQPVNIGQALKELNHERHEKGKGDFTDDEEEADQDKADSNGNWLFGKSKDNKRQGTGGRSSELRYLGHEYFAIDNLKNRMSQLFWAYTQLKSRSSQGLPLFIKADFSKVVLAGYDLGAQTVTAALGEKFFSSLPEDNELKPIAAIILSPSIDLAKGNVRGRFEKLNLPLLVITGNEDNDPYAISSASVRSAVWEFSPPGNKYLLSLSGNVHKLLSGADMGGGMVKGQSRDHDSEVTDHDKAGGGRMLQSTNQYGGHGRNQDSGDSSGIFGGRANGGRKDPDLGYKQVAAVASASSAFLDSVIKYDEFAQFWIKNKANKWLDRAGSLRLR